MKRYLPDIALVILLCGIAAFQYSVGFPRLVYMFLERVDPEYGQAPVASPSSVPERCGELEPDPDRPDEALECLEPFVDPARGRTADDRPPGHFLALMIFLTGMPTVIGLCLFRWRRDIRAWLAGPRFVVPGSIPFGGRREAGMIAGVMAVAVFTRVFQLGSWVVEESEWGAVERLPLLDIVFHGRETMHEPPLFTTLQHFVYMVNDHSLAWTRSLTCLTGILLVGAVWRSSRMIFGPRTALLAALLAAVHPFMVSNSHVMRPYSLASFFVIMALPHAWRMANRDTEGVKVRDAAMFSVFGGLAIWTHYTSLIALFVMYLYMAAGLARGPRRSLFMAMLASAGVLALFFTPFVPYFLTDFFDKQGSGVSPEFVGDMLAAITGLPFGLGWIVAAFPLVTGLRRARSGRFLLFFGSGMVIVMIATIFMIWWEPTHLAVLAPITVMMVAASAVRLNSRRAPMQIAPYLAGMAVMTGVLFSLPSENRHVWEAVRPMTWHGMSYRLQADAVIDLMGSDPDTYQCADVYMTPVDNISGFIYYWGPVTPQEVGMRPIEPNNFRTFNMDVRVGSRIVPMRLTPIERLWSWERGQWMDLEAALRERGCLWYQKSYQNCALGTGRFFSSNDCRWLARNCRAVVSMPDSELWFCSRPQRLP